MNRNPRNRNAGSDDPYRNENYYGTRSSQRPSYGRQSAGGYGSGYYGREAEDWRNEDDRYYSRHRDDEGWVDRAGDRIRRGWENLKDRFDNDDDRNYNTRSRYERDDDRNWFERAGDRISEKWNDLTGRDEDDYRSDYRRQSGDYDRGYGRGYDERNFGRRDDRGSDYRGTSGYGNRYRGNY